MDTFKVDKENFGQRLDVYLAKLVDLSRSQIKNLIDNEKVLVNNKTYQAIVIYYKMKFFIRERSKIYKINNLFDFINKFFKSDRKFVFKFHFLICNRMIKN